MSWARQGLERLARIPSHEERPFFIPFRGRPLRFLKQVVTMMFSATGPEFASRHLEPVKFVLDWRTTGLPPEYKFDLVLVRSGFARQAGGFGKLDLSTGAIEVASEIAHFPFAVRMIVGRTHGTRRGALEWFAQLAPDDEREVWLYTRSPATSSPSFQATTAAASVSIETPCNRARNWNSHARSDI